eukprot:scaffold847_cov172-Ochromonas_danica.AAC.19
MVTVEIDGDDSVSLLSSSLHAIDEVEEEEEEEGKEQEEFVAAAATSTALEGGDGSAAKSTVSAASSLTAPSVRAGGAEDEGSSAVSSILPPPPATTPASGYTVVEVAGRKLVDPLDAFFTLSQDLVAIVRAEDASSASLALEEAHSRKKGGSSRRRRRSSATGQSARSDSLISEGESTIATVVSGENGNAVAVAVAPRAGGGEANSPQPSSSSSPISAKNTQAKTETVPSVEEVIVDKDVILSTTEKQLQEERQQEKKKDEQEGCSIEAKAMEEEISVEQVKQNDEIGSNEKLKQQEEVKEEEVDSRPPLDLFHDPRFPSLPSSATLDKSIDIRDHFHNLFRASSADGPTSSSATSFTTYAPRSAPSSGEGGAGAGAGAGAGGAVGGAVGNLRRMVSNARRLNQRLGMPTASTSRAAATAISVTTLSQVRNNQQLSPNVRRRKRKNAPQEKDKKKQPLSTVLDAGSTRTATTGGRRGRWHVVGAYESYRQAERALQAFEATYPVASTLNQSFPCHRKLPPLSPPLATTFSSSTAANFTSQVEEDIVLPSSGGLLNRPNVDRRAIDFALTHGSGATLRVVRDLNRMQWLVESSDGNLRSLFQRHTARLGHILHPNNTIPTTSGGSDGIVVAGGEEGRLFTATFSPASVFSNKNSKHVSYQVPVAYRQSSPTLGGLGGTIGAAGERQEMMEQEEGGAMGKTSIRSLQSLLLLHPPVHS